jgi:hypothetical protein
MLAQLNFCAVFHDTKIKRQATFQFLLRLNYFARTAHLHLIRERTAMVLLRKTRRNRLNENRTLPISTYWSFDEIILL